MLSGCKKMNDQKQGVQAFARQIKLSLVLIMALGCIAVPAAHASAGPQYVQSQSDILVDNAVMKAYIRKHAAETRRRNAQMRKRGQIPYRTQSKHARRKSNRG